MSSIINQWRQTLTILDLHSVTTSVKFNAWRQHSWFTRRPRLLIDFKATGEVYKSAVKLSDRWHRLYRRQLHLQHVAFFGELLKLLMLHNRTLTVSNACTRVCYCSVLNYNEVHYSSFNLIVQPWWAVLDSHYPSMMYTNYPDTPVSGTPALLPSMIYPSILTNNTFPDLANAFSWRDPKTKLL